MLLLPHQVQKVLKTLACEGGLRADHLELLWALTEKARLEGTLRWAETWCPAFSRNRQNCQKFSIMVEDIQGCRRSCHAQGTVEAVAHACGRPQVDTFEAVKNNVYGVLGDLAKDLPGPELDLLFSKFEACAGWPAPDALKAMDLLKQLAKSDATVSARPHFYLCRAPSGPSALFFLVA